MNAVQLRYIELYIFFKKKLYYKDQNKRKKNMFILTLFWATEFLEGMTN